MNCICSPEYLRKLPEEHSQKCYDKALDTFEKELYEHLKNRIAWYTVKSRKDCTFPYAHSAHGGCGGQSFDAT